jgi:16S rRNA (guanine527-N7)-methyltransferase
VIELNQLRELLIGAAVPTGLAERLALYGAELLNANRRVNLTGARSPQALLPHLLDSLSVVPYVSDPLVDVGAGGGLPAIPLALATGVSLTLVEATVKKARFLETTLASLGLPGRVIAERAETAAHHPSLRGAFQCGTARAVASAPSVAELLLPFLATGGLAVLQRGALAASERNAVADASLMLGGRLEKEVALEGDHQILLIRKTGPTPGRFPRAIGIPARRPLCV